MSGLLLSAARCLLGAAVIAGAFLGVRRYRVRQGGPLLDHLLERGLQYSLVGLLAGLAAPPSLVVPLTDLAHVVVALLGGWYGMTLGLELDARTLRHTSPLAAAADGLRAGGVVLAVLGGGYLGLRLLGGLGLAPAPAFLLMLCGICAAQPAARAALAGPRERSRPQRRPVPLAAVLGVALAGLGAMQARGLPFRVQQPFAPAGQAVLVDSLMGEAGWCLFLGAVTGLVVDLLTRGADRGDLVLLVLAGLALGAGVAAVLGMEPLWVGLASGAWLINCTLRRPEILRAAEGSHVVLRAGLYLSVGWYIGSGAAQQGLDAQALVWAVAGLLVLRTAGTWLGNWSAVRVLGPRAPKWLHESAGEVPEIEDVGLVMAVSMGVAATGPAGVGLVAAVAASHWGLAALRVRRQQAAGRGQRPARPAAQPLAP